MVTAVSRTHFVIASAKAGKASRDALLDGNKLSASNLTSHYEEACTHHSALLHCLVSSMHGKPSQAWTMRLSKFNNSSMPLCPMSQTRSDL